MNVDFQPLKVRLQHWKIHQMFATMNNFAYLCHYWCWYVHVRTNERLANKTIFTQNHEAFVFNT